MIGISMITSDTLGHVELDDGDNVLSSITARVSRQATLDGGAVITHSGISQGDRTFKIKTDINAEQRALIEHIYENAVLVNVSCSEGFFQGSISSVDTSTPNLTMTILIKDREN